MHCILHIPHSSTVLPPDLRETIALSDAELELELLRMTDWFTDELFDGAALDIPAVRFPISRLGVDPERFLDDSQEPMAKHGLGVIYTRTSHGAPLRPEPDAATRAQWIERWYAPHHAELNRQVDGALAEHGRALIIDCHSFPAAPLPYELHQSPDRPDICVGTDDFHTPSELTRQAVAAFEQAGLSVAIDRPFAGSLVPMEHYRQTPEVSSLMIEINRGLYMDEQTGEKSSRFDDLKATVHSVVATLGQNQT